MAEGKGLLDSLTGLVATLVAVAHTRLELLSSDLEEDRAHFLRLLVLALVGLFCLGVGVVLVTLLLVLAFWESYRLLVLAILTGGFLLAGLLISRGVLRMARTKPRLFSSSLTELLKDRQQLTHL